MDTGQVQAQEPGQLQQSNLIQAQATLLTPHAGVIANPYENLECRNYARIVACVDMVLSLLELVTCAALLVITAGLTVENVNLQYAFLVIVAILLVCCMNEEYIAWRLLSATNPITRQPEALKRTRFHFWHNVLLVLLEFTVGVFRTVGFADSELFIGNAMFLAVLLRGISMFFVHKFIEELQSFRVAQQMRGELVDSMPVVTATTVPVLITRQ